MSRLMLLDENSSTTPLDAGASFVAKTDLWASAVGPAGGGSCAARMEIVLIDA